MTARVRTRVRARVRIRVRVRDGVVDRALRALEVGVVWLPAGRLREGVEPTTRAARR